MEFVVTCDTCAARVKVPLKRAGTEVHCPKCGFGFLAVCEGVDQIAGADRLEPKQPRLRDRGNVRASAEGVASVLVVLTKLAIALSVTAIGLAFAFESEQAFQAGLLGAVACVFSLSVVFVLRLLIQIAHAVEEINTRLEHEQR